MLSASHGLAGMLLQAHAGLDLLNHTHLMREGVVRLPRATGRGSSFLEHLIDLFQSKAFGLGDEEIGEQQAKEKSTAPDEEDLDLEISFVCIDHVWGDSGDDTVPDPVGGCRECNTLGSNWKRVDLTNNNPSRWTPGNRKGGNVEADEHNETGAPRAKKKQNVSHLIEVNGSYLTYAAWLPSLAVPMIATRNSQMHITTAPQMSKGRRPSFSIIQNEAGVATTLTTFIIVEMRKAFFIPTDWKKVVP